MNSRGQFNARTEDRHEFPKLKAEHGEDPARFLQSSKDLALARVDGIRDEELLEAYRAVAKQILSGSSQSDVLEALDERERELTGESIEPDEPTPEPETTTDPVPATDGGQTITPDDEGDAPDEVHPDTKGVDAGEVLVLETADRTEFIFASTPDADEPYLMRAFDGDDERTDEAIGMTFDEVLKRIDDEDPQSVDEIDIRPPALAASNGGDS